MLPSFGLSVEFRPLYWDRQKVLGYGFWRGVRKNIVSMNGYVMRIRESNITRALKRAGATCYENVSLVH